MYVLQIRIHGCYESLEGGWTEDGWVDFTGGIGQRVNLDKERDKLPKNFFDTLLEFQAKGSMMGSCIFVSILCVVFFVCYAYRVTCHIVSKYIFLKSWEI